MFTDQSFIENKAVIDGETVKVYWTYQRIHPLGDAAFDTNCLTQLRILKIITVGLKMDSGNAIHNCYMM